MKVAIVGGGVAGLAVAEALLSSTARIDVTVYEQQPRAGGLVRTERRDGYLCEHGPSGFLDNTPSTLALIERLGLAKRVIASRDEARRRYVVRSGRLRAVPAAPPGLLTSGVLPVAGAIRALAEPLVRPKPGDTDESIRAFATRRFGRHAADVLADAMVSGIFAGDPDALSLEACFPDLPRMEREHGSVVKALIARGRRPRARLMSFPAGMEELVSALVERIGSRLRLSCAVRAIEPLERGCRISLASGEVATVDAVVVTCDAPTIGRLIGPSLVPASDLDVPAAPIAVVCLGYPSTAIPRPLDGFGFLAPRRAGVRILGAVWESSIFVHRAPEGHVLLRAMVGGATDPAVVGLDDASLVGVVTGDLRSVMGISAPPVLAQVIRHRPGLPQYVLGHPERLRRLEQALSGFPRLHLGGHSFRGVGVNALVEDAARLASRIVATTASPA